MGRTKTGSLKLGVLSAGLVLALGLGAARADDEAPAPTVAKPLVTWEKDLTAAQKNAREKHELVLDFYLLGNLGSADC